MLYESRIFPFSCLFFLSFFPHLCALPGQVNSLNLFFPPFTQNLSVVGPIFATSLSLPPHFPRWEDYLSRQASSREPAVTTTHLPRFLVFQSPKPGALRSGDLPHRVSEFREGTAATLVSELLSPCSHVTALDHREIDREPEQTNKKTCGNDAENCMNTRNLGREKSCVS